MLCANYTKFPEHTQTIQSVGKCKVIQCLYRNLVLSYSLGPKPPPNLNQSEKQMQHKNSRLSALKQYDSVQQS